MSRWKLAAVITAIALLTVLVAIIVANVILWVAGDWEEYHWALTLTLKIMWGTWAALVVAGFLTFATAFGWKFRRPRPGNWPAALKRAYAEGKTIAAEQKSGATSFTFTVVLTSLLGIAVLATVLIVIIGDWSRFSGPLGLALKIIWGVWWPLAIATVLVRIIVFGKQRNRGRDEKNRDRKSSQP